MPGMIDDTHANDPVLNAGAEPAIESPEATASAEQVALEPETATPTRIADSNPASAVGVRDYWQQNGSQQVANNSDSELIEPEIPAPSINAPLAEGLAATLSDARSREILLNSDSEERVRGYLVVTGGAGHVSATTASVFIPSTPEIDAYLFTHSRRRAGRALVAELLGRWKDASEVEHLERQIKNFIAARLNMNNNSNYRGTVRYGREVTSTETGAERLIRDKFVALLRVWEHLDAPTLTAPHGGIDVSSIQFEGKAVEVLRIIPITEPTVPSNSQAIRALARLNERRESLVAAAYYDRALSRSDEYDDEEDGEDGEDINFI